MPDRTLVAVKRQLSAMRAKEYDVGIYHRQEDKMSRRIWDINQIIKSIAWLKSQNFSDHDIYIRPNGSLGLVFFDDLNIGDLDRMKQEGIKPCVVLQSSPQNYQGWIRVSKDPIDKTIATKICKLVAKQFGGDINSADWRHYGRLSGFTNRKAAYIDTVGRYPFVLLDETNTHITEGNRALLIAAKTSIEQDKQVISNTLKISSSFTGDASSIEQYYLDQIDTLQARFGNEFDCSIADWWLVKRFVQRGVPKNEARSILSKNSPALKTRKNNHADTYLDVTLDKAYGL